MNDLSITLTAPADMTPPPANGLPEFISQRRRRMRQIRWSIAAAMVAIVLLTVVRLSQVTGWWTPVRIEGPSMAPTYFGAHFHVTCDDCGATFECDASQSLHSTRVACPNCGYRQNQLDKANLQRGDRVLIDRWYSVNKPRRGAAVAIENDDGQLLIKRIVALPGERWGIRNGDLYINDQLERKTLHQLLEQRILVHDNNHLPKRTRNLPPRWQGEGEETHWRESGTGFTFEPGNSSGKNNYDWLRYTHWACTDNLGERTQSTAITDNDAYNPAINRNLNWVPDIMLTCSVECEADGRFAIAAHDEPHRFEIVFDRAKKSVSLVDFESDKEIARSPERIFADTQRLEILVALCDQQVFVAEGGQTLISYTYDRLEPCETQKPFAIGGNRGRLKVTNLRIYRDVYYLDPLGTGLAWTASEPLAPGFVAVLGDNSPASIDSRQAEHGLAIHRILGVVYRPFWTVSR